MKSLVATGAACIAIGVAIGLHTDLFGFASQNHSDHMPVPIPDSWTDAEVAAFIAESDRKIDMWAGRMVAPGEVISHDGLEFRKSTPEMVAQRNCIWCPIRLACHNIPSPPSVRPASPKITHTQPPSVRPASPKITHMQVKKKAQDDPCKAIDWRLREIDSDLLDKPLDVVPNLCAEVGNPNCTRLNQLVSSIAHPEFKKFVKNTVNFVVQNNSNSIKSPVTAACSNRESPDAAQCQVSIYPEFWKIKNATAQELVLILETGKIASMERRRFAQVQEPTDTHLRCLGSIYAGGTGVLSDFADDSHLGLSVIGTIPLKRSP
jgi:hypothetical protein